MKPSASFTIVLILTFSVLSSKAIAASSSEQKPEKATAMNTTSEYDASDLQLNQWEKDIDKDITNKRLRAQSGSKSRFSLSLTGGYSGGSLEDPLGKTRPNIAGNPEMQTSTSAGGSFSARYRTSAGGSVTLGGGYSMLTPFHNASEPNVDNPSLGYTHAFKWAGLQNITTVSGTYGTSEFWRAANLTASASIAHTFLSRVNNSPLQVGGILAYSYKIYDGATPSSLGVPSRYDVAIIPTISYDINDIFTFRTVFGWLNLKKPRSAGTFDFQRTYEYQSIGLSTSITRDIYLYPNIQFLADDLDVAKSKVGISATLNLF